MRQGLNISRDSIYFMEESIFNFKKGDLLILHLDNGKSFQLLVVHVVEECRGFYCWDRQAEVYRLIQRQKGLHLLCPQFDPSFPSDVDWANEWLLEMHFRKMTLGQDPEGDLK